jgi:hypothetical protein
MIDLNRGDIMRSIMRFFITFLLVVLSYVGGWFSFDLIKQDPFLSTLLNVNQGAYDRFLNDMKETLTNANLVALNESQLDASVGSLRSYEANADGELLYPEGQGEGTLQDREGNEMILEVNTGSNREVMELDPVKVIGELSTRMTNKEKLSFIVWARTRFDNEEIKQITSLLEEGLNQGNMLQLYQILRENLNGNDYDYLLSFLDRYLVTQENAVPASQWQTDGTTNNKPY